ncbi:MAG: PDZ domain-containing protein, partial [Planctomycetota bacterium]
VPESRIAVGYGFRKSTEPNAPPHWGKTSWLVMGSGGQISSLSDLYKWEVAIRAGKIMSPESTKSFVGMGNRVSADGDMYGFEFVHSHDPECMFMLISNAIASREDRRKFDQLGRRLYKLTESELHKPGKYTVGLAMSYDTQENSVKVHDVIAGGACDGSGIRAGDVLVSANGIKFGHPTDVLRSASMNGRPIKFLVTRDGEPLEFTVKPKLRTTE